uniref:Acyl-coenzyme A thioesterase 9, mitochondrial n=1 Tax=Cacopsylla melanoneura TaxID=428564 RepID=A0A8D8RZ80_9HEMI
MSLSLMVRSLRLSGWNHARVLSYKLCFSKMSTQAESEPLPTINEIRARIVKLMGANVSYDPKNIHLAKRDHLLKYLPRSQDELPVRSMQDSFEAATIPLSEDLDLRDKMVTVQGAVRLGRFMEIMDLFAVYIALKHLQLPNLPPDLPTPYVIVTVLVDDVTFTSYKAKPDKDIRISGQTTFVGKTSMEISVWLDQLSDGAWEKITKAVFVMVARNSNNTASALVNKIEPGNEREKHILATGLERTNMRKIESNESLLVHPPSTFEQQMIHKVFLDTIDKSNPLLGRRILPPYHVWMEATRQNSVIHLHPEERNLHNKIFGGFLMRQALELAWLCGYMHSKQKPKLWHINDVSFKQPVEVGSLLRMTTEVVYTEKTFMQVCVNADVYHPPTKTTTETNSFHYTFESLEDVEKVIPRSYHEAMMYIDGKRRYDRAIRLITE